MKKEECIFCKIVSREIPSKIIFENEKILAFLDIFPILKGHTIVIPKDHFKNIEDIDEEYLIDLFRAVKKLSILIHKRLNIEGYNILQNNFKAAGQEIEHFHIHIIPRKENDERFQLKIPRKQAKEEDLHKVLEILTR